MQVLVNLSAFEQVSAPASSGAALPDVNLAAFDSLEFGEWDPFAKQQIVYVPEVIPTFAELIAQLPSELVEELVFDKDGIPIPDHSKRAFRDHWESQSIEYRRYRARLDLQAAIKCAEKEAAKLKRQRKASNGPATKFTTQYGLDWGRKQLKPDGKPWALIDRERFDPRTMRHHDLELACDLIFDGGNGRVAIQAAGKGQRLDHYRRFELLGGPAKARTRFEAFIYLVFERGNKTPISREDWI